MSAVWVAATRNRHKLDELRRLLPEGIELRPAPALDVAETGATYVDNALLKARAVHAATGMPAVADDSGIEVDALGGMPGVHSARFAGEGASDADNLSLLLARLGGPSPARYRCVVALVDGRREVLGEGVLEGTVIMERRGQGGFGYDPAFVPAGDTRTVGEMSSGEKDAISHRARAVRDLLRQLGP